MYRRTDLDDRPWDDEAIREHAMRRLNCVICKSGAPDHESMARHLAGGPHLKEMQRYREDWCRRRASRGESSTRDYERSSSSSSQVMKPMQDLQKDWSDRYTEGAKGVKRDVLDIQAMPAEIRGQVFNRNTYDFGQYTSSSDLYCTVCDVRVLSRNIMESHLSGKEHLRRMKPQRQYKCDICLVYVSSEETLESHLKGNAHIRKASQLHEQKQDRKRQKVEPSEGELEELYVTREANVKLQEQVDNLQETVRRLLQYKNTCALNHGNGIMTPEDGLKELKELREFKENCKCYCGQRRH